MVCAPISSEIASLPVGVDLRSGRYRIGRTLGSPGGFGITYLAWDDRLERRVAIKEYFPRQGTARAADGISAQPQSVSSAADFRVGLEGFLNEARRLAKLDHPNIVKVHDYCEAHGTGYLVMSYYEGADLSEHVQRAGGRLEWREALVLITPVLDGLAAVHASGLIHRDIKPANVYLASAGHAHSRSILIDFGAARWATTTHELTAVLTEGFAPLEQYPGCGPQGAFTDVYATAATLYSVLSGQVPASAPSRLAGSYVPNLSDLGHGIPRRVADAIEYGLSVAVEERPQTATEFARLLRAADPSANPTSGGGMRISPSSVGATMTHPSATSTAFGDEAIATTRPIAPRPAERPAPARSGNWLILGVLCIVLAAVGGLMWMLAGGRTDAAPPVSATAETGTVDLGVRVPTSATEPTSATNDIRAAFDSARSRLAAGDYAASMTELGRAHDAASTLRGLSPIARTALDTRLDSLADVILTACKAERELLSRRGENRKPCSARPW